MAKSKVNDQLRAYHDHLLGPTAATSPSRQVTHHDVLDDVIRNPERALRTNLRAMYTGAMSSCAADTIFSHLIIARH
ncbi:MAG TPA: hypothetical protein VIY48_02045 [Candidatus Paceibacterota bacterium]